MLGTVAGATVGATKGFEAIDKELKTLWPGFFNDKGLNDIQNNGVHAPLWWPKWLPKPFSHPSAPSGQKQSFAPQPSDGGQQSVPVHVTNAPDVHVANGHDLATGVSGAISGQMNRPQSGYTGSDMNQSPWGSATYGNAQ